MNARNHATALATAIHHLVNVLAPGEWFAVHRNQRSVKFDAQAERLPVLIRSMIESEAERRGFAERVLPPNDDVNVHRSLADGVLWLHAGEWLRVAVGDRGIELSVASTAPEIRADFRIHPELTAALPMPILVHHALGNLRRTLDGAA